MLEKISEISVDNRFTGGGKSNSNSKYYVKNVFNNSKEADHDSISLSPAFKMAAKFRLKIKEVLKESADKYKVVFELNDFTFEVKIELNKLLDENLMQLNGTRKVEQYSNSFLVSFWINYYLDSVVDDSEIMLSTENVEKLSDKIEETSMGSDFNIYNETSLVMFTEDIEHELNDELFNICSIAVKLIEKLFEQNLSVKLGHEENYERHFTLQLVKQTKL